MSEAERKDQEESKQDQPIVFGKNINLTVTVYTAVWLAQLEKDQSAERGFGFLND